MIAPQELPRPSLPDMKVAEPHDRAGPYRISELQNLLDPFLHEGEGADNRARWPLGYALLFMLLSSATLWVGIILVVKTLV